jgi:hypothetical protein
MGGADEAYGAASVIEQRDDLFKGFINSGDLLFWISFIA